jgi:predicted KAP-like P-loop ATPase
MNSRTPPIGPDISADRPGRDPSLDRLGYAPFAKRLAESISAMPRAEGQVLALYGGWGFGKTTMLNYVRHYLEEMEAAKRPVVISFNPWWFSGHEDLVRAFFGQISAKIQDRKEFPPEVRTGLADFADAISDIPLPYFSWGKLVGRAVRPKVKDIEKLKNEIAAALRKQAQRILVVIDDIDRLTSEEIRQVFRAVKSVGDFPNVTYLVAFDKSVVVRSLGQVQGGSGEDYLEKIVQIPFELPLVDRVSIRTLFFEQVDTILVGIDQKSFDQTYWGNIFLEGIDKFLETPRDVVRFTNALGVTFRAVIGEVNPVDFIAVEALRMFCPEVYNTIKSNREMFTGHAPNNLGHPRGNELRQFHDRWIARIHDTSPLLEEPIKDMVQRLFPRLQAVWGNTQFGPEWDGEWRRELRVCGDSVFPVYFSLAIPTGEISNTEMQSILAKVVAPEEFGAEILKLAKQTRPDGKSKAAAFMVRLQDYTATEIATDQIEPIVLALMDIGDELMSPEDASSGMFDLGIDVQIGRVIWQLVKRVEPPRRFEILRGALERGHALYVIQKSLIVLGQQQGLYGETARPQQEWFVTAEQLTQLDGIFVEKIRRASQDGALLRTARLLLVLSFWREKGGLDEARTWVAETLKDDSRLAEFLESCLHSSSSFQYGDSVGRRHDRLDPKWLEPYCEVDQIVGRVRTLHERVVLSDRKSRAVSQFLKEYDFRKRGGNPDDPFAQDEIA